MHGGTIGTKKQIRQLKTALRWKFPTGQASLLLGRVERWPTCARTGATVVFPPTGTSIQFPLLVDATHCSFLANGIL
jgi:hypothetical protein